MNDKPKMRVIKGMDDRRNSRLNEVRTFMADRSWRTRASPDASILNKSFFQDIFVYGSLKQDFRSHKLIHSQSQPLGTGWTMTRTLKMYENKKGGYPILLPDTNGDHIYGQIYRIPTYNLFELDRFEQNGILFQRQQRYVWIIEKHSREHKRASCWVYVGVKSYWDHHMKSQGKLDPFIVPCNTYKRNEEPSYTYQIWTKTQDDFYKNEQNY